MKFDLSTFFINGFTLFLFTLLITPSIAQIEANWLDTTDFDKFNDVYIFSNRPLELNSDSSYTFKNKYNKATGVLYFAGYDYDTEKLQVTYSIEDQHAKTAYPQEHIQENIFYQIYKELRQYKTIQNLNILIPGYAKTYESQVNDFIKRLKSNYGDTLYENSIFLTFAWAAEWRATHYFGGKKSAKYAADDFAIFQHMLEDFLADTAFFVEGDRDISINLFCLSMGNELLRQYAIKRQEQGIKFVKTYDWIVNLGCDVPWNSFDDNKGYDNISLMTDSIDLFANSKDVLLRVSSLLSFKRKMGLTGPNPNSNLPSNLVITEITRFLTDDDFAALNHDYFLKNDVVKSSLINWSNENNPNKSDK